MQTERRQFLLNSAVATGLASAGAMLATIVGRFLYPRSGLTRIRQLYLAPASDFPAGTGRPFTLPDGTNALVANTGDEVVALSNVCPHLGCKVHWEEGNARFVCPCHQGIFDQDGTALSGPPADEGQRLTRHQVVRIGEHLFLEIEEIVQA